MPPCFDLRLHRFWSRLAGTFHIGFRVENVVPIVLVRDGDKNCSLELAIFNQCDQ